ncbi:MAG: hypothetical protein H6625_00135 [Bdellovibrionaceae bacterium]|nr:hypothetical protein [Pseudobdellovibrionaceae bacterium]
MRKIMLISLLGLILGGCATYNYAEKVKMVSFDDDVSKGKSVGPVRGEDCTWTVLGYQLGGLPTLDRAFINARNQAGTLESAGLKSSDKSNRDQLRYINNVQTRPDGFNAAGIVAKNCIVVTGVAYK